MFVRMAHICFIASHKVNGVSEGHTEALKTIVYKDFHELFPSRIISVQNGVSPRRWMACANPLLTKLITKKLLGEEEWVSKLELL
jgi:starch phosphorylase